ncbi:MAG: phosphoribosyl-ATP pyrophosphohydrolase [Candidatus Micrarchaeaceae archaeon]
MRILNKLVRDNIPDIIRSQGQRPVTEILSEAAYKEALLKKLHEEVAEFTADENVEELADILEVIYALRDALQVTHDVLESVRQNKAAERGAFRKKIFLLSVEE